MKRQILVRKAPNPFSVLDLRGPRSQGESEARRNTSCISFERLALAAQA